MKLNFRIIFLIHCPTLISSSCFRKIMSRLSIATVRCIHHTWRLWWISCEINSRGSQCAKSRYLDRGHYLHVVTRPTRIALVKRIRDDLGINQVTYSLSGSLAENFSLFREFSTANLTLRQTIRRANLVDFAKHQNTLRFLLGRQRAPIETMPGIYETTVLLLCNPELRRSRHASR